MKNTIIYDVLGKAVKEIPNLTSNLVTIDVSQLAQGVYMVEITSQNLT